MKHYHDAFGWIDNATLHCAECRRQRQSLAESYDIWANCYETLADGDVIAQHLAWLCSACDTTLRVARQLHVFRDAVLSDHADAVFVKEWHDTHRTPTADVPLFVTVGYDIGDDE